MKNKWLALSTTLLVGACASGAPKWAMHTGEWMKTQPDKAFWGIGRASPAIKDKLLRMEAAENASRTELSKQMSTFVGYAAEEYNSTDRGQFMERTNRAFSANYISGVEIVDRGYDSDGTAYALARFDLDRAKKLIEMSKDLDEAAKDFLRKNADNLFERMRKSAEQAKAK